MFEKNPSPGERLIVNPSEARSPEAKRARSTLFNDESNSYNKGIALSKGKLPTHTIIKEPLRSSDIDKLISAADIGHELKHHTETLTLPDREMTSVAPYTEGHHIGGIYESDKLIKDVRGISDDSKEFKAAAKASKKLGGVTKPFRKLMSIVGGLGPIGAGAAALAALRSGDSSSAALHAASAIDPTGLTDAALEVKNRLGMSPEEALQQSKEDEYSAMPGDLANEFRMVDEARKAKQFKKVRGKLK
jgi:hypothetical protein